MLVLLLVLCSTLTPALCCDWLQHYSHLSNQSLTLIKLMGGELTEHQSQVSFPIKLYRRIQNQTVESQLLFIRDSLQLISDLYRHDNLSSVTWDTDKTQHFLEILHRQREEVNGCVWTNRTAAVQLKKYYNRLARSSLNRTGGSAESWEVIRWETKLHLEQLHMLVASIRTAAVTSRRRSD